MHASGAGPCEAAEPGRRPASPARTVPPHPFRVASRGRGYLCLATRAVARRGRGTRACAAHARTPGSATRITRSSEGAAVSETRICPPAATSGCSLSLTRAAPPPPPSPAPAGKISRAVTCSNVPDRGIPTADLQYYAVPALATNSGPLQWATCPSRSVTIFYTLDSLCDVSCLLPVQCEEKKSNGDEAKKIQRAHFKCAPFAPMRLGGWARRIKLISSPIRTNFSPK
jgi:hypothetical protein